VNKSDTSIFGETTVVDDFRSISVIFRSLVFRNHPIVVAITEQMKAG